MDVQLGICDEAMPRADEVTEGFWVNKIGGTCVSVSTTTRTHTMHL